MISSNEKEVIAKIESIDWRFEGVTTTYLSHKVHPYVAKFIPQIPNTFIKTLTKKGDTVWDVFGGCGTTALEALLLGRNCISTDLNPIGTISGLVKTSILDDSDIRQITNTVLFFEEISGNDENLKQCLYKYSDKLEGFIPAIPKLNKWFCSCAISELSFISWYITKNSYTETVNNILRLSFSKTVGFVSNQKSETDYCAIEKKLSQGETIKSFVASLKEVTKKVESMNEYLSGLGITETPWLKFFTKDVTSGDIVGDNKLIKEGSVDLIVTSPPYPKALDYFVFHRFRLFWLGYDPRILAKKDIGAHIRFMNPRYGYEQYENEMIEVLDNIYRALKKDCYAVFVIGNGKSHGEEYDAVARLRKLAEKKGFKTVTVLERTYPEHKRYVQQKRRRKEKERILLLRK